MDYQELIDDHGRIDALAGQLERAVAGDAATAAQVDDLLARLSGIVADHLSKEDSFIYPDLARCNDAGDATGLVVEFESLKRDWQTYLAAWRDGMASQDWPAFRDATLGMLHRLRERVMKETGLLYSMALREGIITLRPDAAPPRS